MELKARVTVLVGMAFLLVVVSAAMPLRVMSGMIEAFGVIDERAVGYATLQTTASRIREEAWRAASLLRAGVAPARAVSEWMKVVDDASQALDVAHRMFPPRSREEAEEAVRAVTEGRMDAEQWERCVAMDLAPRLADELGAIAINLRKANVDQLDEMVRRFVEVRRVVPVVTLVSLLMALIVMGGVGRWLLRPIRGLAAASEEWSRGRLNVRAPVERNDELGRLAESMNRMAEDLASLQQRLAEAQRLAAIGEMTAAISHNIRNPLSGIRSAAQLLERRAEGEERRLARGIVESVDRLERWIRHLLRMDETMPGTEFLVPLALRDVVERAIRAVSPVAAGRNVKVGFDPADPAARVNGDAGLLEQAVVAVLTNAIEASPPGGKVTVGLRPTDFLQRPAWEVLVRDEGPGIADELASRVFDPYFSTKQTGFGLGLASAMRIVRRHHGTITLQTRSESRGGWVRIVLPGGRDEETPQEKG